MQGTTGMPANMLKKQTADLDAPEVRGFVQMLTNMRAQLRACQMSLDMMDLEQDDLFAGRSTSSTSPSS